MNRNSGLALNTSRIASSFGIVVEMLVDAAVLDDHHVAGLPGNVPAVVHVVAAALEHVEHRAVEVAVLLAVGAGRIGLDVRFHRLDDGGGLRADDALAELAGAALPRHLLRGIDALLLEQRLVEMAIGAFERPHEGALLCPALPFLVLLLLGVFVGLVVTDARPGLLVHACHSGASLESAAMGRPAPPAAPASFDGRLSLRDYGQARNAIAACPGRSRRAADACLRWCATDTDLGFTRDRYSNDLGFTRDRHSNARKSGKPDLRGSLRTVASGTYSAA